MDLLSIVLIALAGLWAGTINAVVGSGTLVTFPVLVALGYPPVTATISNAMGLIAGNISSSWGYRREIFQVRHTLAKLLPASLIGGIAGASLLLHLPETVFSYVAPVLIVVALLLVAFQPKLAELVRSRKPATPNTPKVPAVSFGLLAAVFFTGIYGGYFVAAQGVLLMGILGVLLNGTLQQANALKNILVLGVNVIAAISYLLFAFDRIEWFVVAVIAVSSFLGGHLGARIGRKLSPLALRSVIIILGLVALGVMVARLVTGSA
ncbi:sulfite exporter TauE/SafE family protein [Micrococcoides hystricis]|uniref:Probable membrane transporter protein n=1 Tax=Micrococcoides hystricis TaxID=1572761 RepID=A0ABV6P764_9MICC